MRMLVMNTKEEWVLRVAGGFKIIDSVFVPNTVDLQIRQCSEIFEWEAVRTPTKYLGVMNFADDSRDSYIIAPSETIIWFLEYIEKHPDEEWDNMANTLHVMKKRRDERNQQKIESWRKRQSTKQVVRVEMEGLKI